MDPFFYQNFLAVRGRIVQDTEGKLIAFHLIDQGVAHDIGLL